MEQHIFVSKLIPPTPVNNYLRRAKLMKKLSDWPHAKCTILHSSAGYGKTSLISQFLNDQKTKSSWYQITPDDDSIFPFLRHFRQMQCKYSLACVSTPFHNYKIFRKLSKVLF